MQPPPPVANLPAGGQGINTMLDTTNLEHSFDKLGRTMVNILQEQRRTTEKLEEHFQLANDTSILQTQALQGNNVLTAQRVYDHMFAEIPMYTGDRPEIFQDQLYRLEVASQMSK